MTTQPTMQQLHARHLELIEFAQQHLVPFKGKPRDSNQQREFDRNLKQIKQDVAELLAQVDAVTPLARDEQILLGSEETAVIQRLFRKDKTEIIEQFRNDYQAFDACLFELLISTSLNQDTAVHFHNPTNAVKFGKLITNIDPFA